jgi:hypothetical protein
MSVMMDTLRMANWTTKVWERREDKPHPKEDFPTWRINQNPHTSGEMHLIQECNYKCCADFHLRCQFSSVLPNWQASIRWACQEIRRLLWSSKVYYCVYKSKLLDHIPSQMQRVHTFTLYFFKIDFNITFQSISLSYKRLLAYRFLH